MRLAVVIVASLVLPGCYSLGNPRIAHPDTVSLIVPGQSTKDEVRELVGRPTKVDFDDEEREKWLYEYSLTKVSARQLIPVVGWFAGPDVETHSLTVLFDDNGVVKKVAGGAARSRDTFQGAGIQPRDEAAADSSTEKPAPKAIFARKRRGGAAS